jgi:hypothetical protein
MAIPKKGSRRINVDAIEYRWTIRSKPTYCQAAFGNEMTAAVELADSPRSTLSITFPWMRCDNWIGNPETPVTPKDIESSIKAAISQGWKPDGKGSAFKYVHESKT